MNKVKKVITGAAFIGSMLFGYNANAQTAQDSTIIPVKALTEQDSTIKPTKLETMLMPKKIATETLIIDNREGNKSASGIPFQRVEIGNDDWTFKYDVNSKLCLSDAPVNVGMLSLNQLYKKNNTIIGAEIFQVGKLDGKDQGFLDVWVAKNYGKVSLMLDLGAGKQKDKPRKDYAIFAAHHPFATLEAALYTQGSAFKQGVDTWTYIFGSVHIKHIFGAFGNKFVGPIDNRTNLTVASAGVYDLENFGTYAFGSENSVTGDIWFKSQTAIGKVNKAFYSEKNFDFVERYFILPSYFSTYFSPACTKGTAVLSFEYKKNPSKDNAETNIVLGTDKTPFVDVGVGVSTEYKNCSSTSNFTFEVFKDFKIGEHISGSVDIRYSNRTKESKGDVRFTYTFQ